ncbi:starch phosphorylase [Pontibacter ummariensis]|uniref:Starch phosphorylase n=1 Tax=Pontibacter ummariensis TaxID=1610492 RepID=A0A239GIQ8_9BACT|nr:alpha-glucan family phosphorylase [Pontibacter ummariensis]PRY11292.1 starch phosphorylase [Pontibacter ummariensis]SNS69057.1 starch phosphorylase [Pontibacter ummariensis]
MASQYSRWYHPYEINEKYNKRVAYFCMEYAIHQALKIYSGGLGFLAGSHMRSAHDLRQNVIGIGMLWKYGYYDQERNEDQTMRPHFEQKFYSFLEDSGITVRVVVNEHPVLVKAMVLKPETFGTAPIYFLTTDIPENDHLARTITHRLYDPEPMARIAQGIVLGVGGAKVVEALGGTETFHMNEGHALPLAFRLYEEYGKVEEVRKRLVFTTHTPEKAGNEEHDINLLQKMSFFNGVTLDEAREITGMHGHMFNHTLAALRLSKVANGVSQLHGEVARDMWYGNDGVCEIKAITNAQNVPFWMDTELWQAQERDDNKAMQKRKGEMKHQLFDVVADQTGKLFRPDVLTIVWARRFAAYKRADLLMRDMDRFMKLLNNKETPVQLVWAGKPYPFDYGAIHVFNKLVKMSQKQDNVSVLTGYELGLSKKLKDGADVWLNTPRRPREASGTSGMTAAMNGAVNLSVQDGWLPEFTRHGENSFVLPIVDTSMPDDMQDEEDYNNLMRILEQQVIPMYYHDQERWLRIVKNSMRDVVPHFDADRMAHQYYEMVYNY